MLWIVRVIELNFNHPLILLDMKKLFVITLILTTFQILNAQNLVDKYKTGKVKLVPDLGYAQGNHWNTVFRSYYDTLYHKPMGLRKSLVVTPDGSVIVNHKYKKYHTKFNPNGKFEKELYIEKGDDEAIKGVINHNTFFTDVDNIGNMVCSDLDGDYKKTLKLDYKANEIIALPNGKFAVLGWAIWKKSFRDFVAIVDYDTNEETLLWEHFTKRTTFLKNNQKVANPRLFNYQMKLSNNYIVSITTMPYSEITNSYAKPCIANVGNKIFIALPSTGEIFIYDLEGNKIGKDKINWTNNFISVEEQKVIQQKAIDKYAKFIRSEKMQDDKNKAVYEKMIALMKSDLNKITKPLPKPTFATVLKDSDGNLLFFEIPKEKNVNQFNVWIYKKEGNFVCKSSFVCDDYELNISPSKMVFHNGYIYGLQLKKNTSGVPLRLVRFRVE